MADPHAHGEPTDVALVRDVAAGSETALASLYDRHASLVFGAALRLTPDRSRAEDVVLERSSPSGITPCDPIRPVDRSRRG